ncbi:MAG: 3'-5' exonuclease [Gammaproteobacteria bacterium]|nr:3'-5' exonuclease [Gammaproteobacteria bacterium]
MANEEFGQIISRIQAGFRRTLRNGVLLADPNMRELQRRLLSMEPKRLSQKSLMDTRFVVIDTETTGLRAYGGDEICSIALLEIEGLKITNRSLSTLINPGRTIPAESTRLHNITDDAVKDAPVIEEVLLDIAEFIGESVIVGHHIGFDIRFLNKILQRELLCHLKHPWLDTMLLYLAMTGRTGQHSLDRVAEYTRIKIRNRHTAYGDAMATAELFLKLTAHLAGTKDPVYRLISRQHEISRV